MKLLFRYIAVFLIGILSLSCFKETISVQNTDIVFHFLNEKGEIYGNEPVRFYVESPHSFRFTEFDFPVAPDMVEKGAEYSVTNGRSQVFEAVAQITDKNIGRGYLMGTIEDVSTGRLFNFKEVYTAFPSNGFSVSLVNPNPSISTVDGKAVSVPVVVGGDDIKVRITCDEDFSGYLILDAYSSSLDLSGCQTNAVVGNAYSPGNAGYIDFEFKGVVIDKDRLGAEGDFGTLSLELTSTLTGRSVKSSLEFICLVPFEVQAELSPAVFYQGQEVTLSVSSNRKNLYLEGVSTTLEGFNYKPNNSYSLDFQNSLSFSASSVVVPRLGKDKLVVMFKDISFTSRSVSVEVPYEVIDVPAVSSFSLNYHRDGKYKFKDAYPDDFSLDKPLVKPVGNGVITMNRGEILYFDVHTEQENVREQYSVVAIPEGSVVVRDVTGDGSFKSFSVEGKKDGAQVSLRVYSTDKPTAYVLAGLKVRYVANLQLYGEFVNVVTKEFSCKHISKGHSMGYLGVPHNISVRLIANDIDKYMAENSNKPLGQLDAYPHDGSPVQYTELSSYPKQLSVGLSFVNSGMADSPYRIDAWRSFNKFSYEKHSFPLAHLFRLYDSDGKISCSSFKPWFLLLGPGTIYAYLFCSGEWDHYNNGSYRSSYPGRKEVPFWYSFTGNTEKSLEDLCEVMWWANNLCYYVKRSDHRSHINTTSETELTLKVTSIEYDRESLFIPYIIYSIGPNIVPMHSPTHDTDYTPSSGEAWWQDTVNYPHGIAWWWHRQNSAFKGIVENTF